MKKLKGISASPGIGIGKAQKLIDDFFSFEEERRIESSNVEREIKKFYEGVRITEEEIVKIKSNVEKIAGKEYSEIFNFHLSLLKDKNLIERVEKIIRNERVSAETALKKFINYLNNEKYGNILYKNGKREIFDIFGKLISNIREKYTEFKDSKNRIIVAKDLSPTQTVSLNKKYINGFVTSMGSATSHTTIIAKALEIPAVVGVEKAMEEINEGDDLLIDGYDGIVIINPTFFEIEKIKNKEKEIKQIRKKIYFLRKRETVTKDNKKIELYANIEFPEEINSVIKYGADGIGLFRTEYLYLKRKDLPTEEEQFLSYKNIIEKMGNKPIIIRTIDVGGDKFISSFQGPRELNSLLGLRGIRFSLVKKDIFITQIKAILRAAYYGNLKIMFPMITTKEEIIETKDVINSAKNQLKKDGVKFKENIEIGIMIETPSAALISDELAREVDFFSIGSNDLIQYTLAADRVNEKLSYLYLPCHPSVLKLIKITIDNAKKNRIKIGICGEMASNPEIACLLIGLGIDELSMAPIAIPVVKEKIIKNYYWKMKEISDKALKLNSHEKIINLLKKNLN
jgi:phosphotransferase system enzyme I (PtsI)